MHNILVIDDDPKLSELLDEYLVSRGYRVQTAASGPAGLKRLAMGSVDLVVLDVMMPGMDGLEVLAEIRKTTSTPVVMLTARGDDTDRIVGLELGADDYMPKPFNPRELLARIKAVLRRSDGKKQESHVLTVADITLDPHRREVNVDGAAVTLTTTEFDILRALMGAAGRVIPREQLMERARGPEWASYDRSVDVHVSHLRKKLGDDAKSPQKIKTIRGIGYLMPTDK